MKTLDKIPAHLLPSQFPRADTEFTRRCVKVKPGTTPEMVMDPDFWVHGSQQHDGFGGGNVLKLYDRIEVIALDGSFELELRVLAIDSRGYWVQTRLIRAWPRELEAALAPKEHAEKVRASNRPGPDPDGYITEWAGGIGGENAHRWRNVDRVGKVVSKGHASKDDALAELERIKAEKAAA